MFSQLLAALLVPAAGAASLQEPRANSAGNVCVIDIPPNGSDATPGILGAFKACGHNDADGPRGKIVFRNGTYNINTVMNTTGLSHVDIDMYNTTLLWDQNIDYWLNNSLPMGYQNQSTAWLFGGDDIRWDGHGLGTLDGNGQVWYDFVNGTNNYPGRPHSITVTGTRDSVFEGIRFVQSQMW